MSADSTIKTVLLVGTFDTKGDEYRFARERFENAGLQTILIDTGVIGQPSLDSDFTSEDVARAGGSTLEKLREENDRGNAVSVMTLGARAIVTELFSKGKFDGIFALGGSGGSTITSHSMRSLPLGIPKVLVSTLVSSSAASFVGESDIALFASVVDIAGVNSISSKIIANAADAMIGMLSGRPIDVVSSKKLIAASMFGVTTQCVTDARRELESHGYEVITFHMTGSGGKSMESLIFQGFFDAVLDVTTTELCDEIIGGTLSAGPDRLTAAVKQGVPQVISLGALDMVNFGAKSTVPEKFLKRNLYLHNENVTLMRTTPEECEKIALDICAKLSKATAPAALMLPLRGVSAISTQGQPFYDPAADDALFSTLRKHVPKQVELIELDCAINDLEFTSALVSKLISYLEKK